MKIQTISDSFYVERAQRGDASAIEALILRHKDRSYQFAYRLTRNSEEAADTVANAFYRVYRSIGSFKGQCAFTTWLYRIITNCYFDVRKKEENHQSLRTEWYSESDEGDAMEFQVVDGSPSGFDEALRGDRNQAVGQALEELPDYQKVVLEMYHLELMSYEEISAILNLPMGTVKSRLNRARYSLANAMTDHLSLFDEYDVHVGKLAVA